MLRGLVCKNYFFLNVPFVLIKHCCNNMSIYFALNWFGFNRGKLAHGSPEDGAVTLFGSANSQLIS